MKQVVIKQQDSFECILPILEEVQNLHAQLYPEVYKLYTEELISEAMKLLTQNASTELWVAFVNDEPMGYILLMTKHITENAFHFEQHVLHIDQLAVLKQAQKLGIGSLLIKKAEERAHEKGIHRIELDHLNENVMASSFFSNKGFIPFRSKAYKQL